MRVSVHYILINTFNKKDFVEILSTRRNSQAFVQPRHSKYPLTPSRKSAILFNMENRGLIFIPDISGFTRFVTQIEIEHSRNIIQELLETLVQSNQIGLTISEIEGDAILFYKFGDMPDLQTLYRQVEKMFVDFHRALAAYHVRKYCQCKACIAAVDLSLKVITHYGEFTGYNVANFSKLIGKDIIVAHQLLKNNIPNHEYWLVTHDMVQGDQPASMTDWMTWQADAKVTESGAIPFHYTQLDVLKTEMPLEDPPRLELAEKKLMYTVTRECDAHIFTAFHAAGDFHHRHLWREGVKLLEELNHFLPRVGMRFRCELNNKETVIFSSSYTFHPERIEFSETDSSLNNAYYYTLEQIEPHRVRITIAYYIRAGFFPEWQYKLFNLGKDKASMERSMDKLVALAESLPDPEAGLLA